jgi:uncharacterized protein
MDATQEMMAAVKQGDAVKIKTLLDHDPGLVNARTETGESAILLATYYGRKEIVEFLLGRGASLNLFEAAAVGKTGQVREHLNKDPARLNAFSTDGFTPLGLASFFGHKETVAFLLVQGAEVNLPSQNPMHVMPLHSAVAGRHTPIAQMLLEHGADANAKQELGFTPLYAAAQTGQVEMVRLLLAHGADVRLAKDDGQMPYEAALEHGHHDVAEMLREAETISKEKTMDANPSIPQEVIDEFVGNAHGNLAKVKELLERYPAIVNANASWNETAIGAAAQTGQVEIADLLLAHGAPRDICTAAMLGQTKPVTNFIRHDPAQANATGAHGIPVLYHAVIRGHGEIAELLLTHGADVNADTGGNPAIHGAVLFGQKKMAAWLLAHGADVNALNYEKKTPLRVTLDKGDDEMAAFLRQRGGRE